MRTGRDVGVADGPLLGTAPNGKPLSSTGRDVGYIGHALCEYDNDAMPRERG